MRMKNAKSCVMLVAGKRMQPARHSFCQHKNHSDRPVLSCFLQCEKAKSDASTDEECKESKNGVPFLLLAEERQDGEYPSCRRKKKTKTENPLASQAIDASLMAKQRGLNRARLEPLIIPGTAQSGRAFAPCWE